MTVGLAVFTLIAKQMKASAMLGAFLGGTIFLLVGCQRLSSTPPKLESVATSLLPDVLEYEGKVIDRDTDEPIPDAEVTLEYGGAPPTLITDSHGVFKFTVRISQETILARFKVDAVGYQPYNLFVILSSQRISIDDLRISKQSSNVMEGQLSNNTVDLPAVDVVISEIDSEGASQTAKLVNRIESDLRAKLRENALEDVTIKVISRSAKSDDDAQQIAFANNAKVVVWGWYDDYGIQMRIFVRDNEMKRVQTIGTREIPLSLGQNDSEEFAFIVRSVIPENVSFISLFVIGSIQHQANNYQKGRDAFDSAMNNLPESVELENRALVHFFNARKLQQNSGDNIEEVVCEYAQAIQLDSGLAEAYNNLGAYLARFSYSPAGGVPSLEAVNCLNATFRSGSFDYLRPQLYFDKALEIRPNWVLPQYNEFVLEWHKSLSSSEWYDEQGVAIPGKRSDITEKLKTFISIDPTLWGTYAILGVIAFQESDYKEAASQFETAYKFSSSSPQLLINLGHTYYALDEMMKAEQAFSSALRIDATNDEAALALARLYYDKKEFDHSLEYLSKVQLARGDSYQFSQKALSAKLLASNIYFDLGQYPTAIEQLQKVSDNYDKIGYDHLVMYLLYLLYSLTQPEKAIEYSENVSYDSDNALIIDYRISNNTGDVTFFEIQHQCKLHAESSKNIGVETSLWGTSTFPCLPVDIKVRIEEVYRMFRHNLGSRIFFNHKTPLVLGAACPFVFTYESNSNIWAFDTTILYKLDSVEKKTSQIRSLTRFDGRILLLEIERETSYIDLLYVEISYTNGSTIKLMPDQPKLQSADEDVLVMNQGDSRQIVFGEWPLIPKENIMGYHIVAEGYYIPYPKLVD